MRLLAIFLFLILSGCKNDVKTEIALENEIDKTVYELWNNYTQSNPEFKNNEIPESWFFHNNKEDADRLAALTLQGKKRAASGLYAWYEEANAGLPQIGTKHIITDFDGKAQAIIEITKVDTIPFNQISTTYAEMDMGTNAEALEKWKKAHWNFFTTAMKESGETPTQDMLVVCETFATIWKAKD